MDRQLYWETVYQTKQPHEVGWTQEVPTPSLRMIRALDIPKNEPVIDIGGGDSKLVEFLLDEGYSDLSVLDISQHGIERARKRLGEEADKVNWLVSDVLDFKPDRPYKIWHDRAVFHFLTQPEQVKGYVALATQSITGFLTIGTFSVDGPKQCSGLDIRQYDEELLRKTFASGFKAINTFREDHITPSGNKQNFLFCTFQKT